MISAHLYIGQVKDKGRGVFTREKIKAGVIIEASPVIVMGSNDRKLLDETLLHDYIFIWGEEKDQCCMALGFIPLYNHSYHSNCEYFMDYDKQIIQIKTVRKIAAGEELTINYNGTWNNPEKVWFDVRE